MTESEFERLAQQGYTRIPVLAEARADLYTPLAVYLKLAGGPHSYLLESVVGGERFGRYSFIGLPCAERIEARGASVRRLLRDARGADVCLEEAQGDPFEFVRAYLRRHRVAPAPGALKFPGGLAGYFGYECVRHVEPRALGAAKPDALGTPDMLLLVSDELAVVDNVMGKLHLVVYADPRQSGAWRAASERLEPRARKAGRARAAHGASRTDVAVEPGQSTARLRAQNRSMAPNPAGGAPVFVARGLAKIYRTGEVDVVALADVSLEIARGEFIVLLGPSGSGKSTLLNILGGLDVPTRGEVRFGDHELTGASEADLTRYRREHVGFVFQFYNLIPSLTVRENVALVTDIAPHPMGIDEAIELVGLGPRRDHFPSQLSGGEQQRVAIARAIVKKPDVLLCDASLPMATSLKAAHSGRSARWPERSRGPGGTARSFSD